MQEATERRLIEQATKGNLSAFDSLMAQYQQRVYALAYKMTRNHDTAETATQDVFLKAFRGLTGFDGESRLMTWLHRITVRVVLDQQRAHKRKPRMLSFTQTAEPETDARRTGSSNPLAATAFNELKEALGEAMMKLPEDHRAALVLVTQEGLTYREAAESLGLTSGTVAWQVWKARQRLKKTLSSYLSA